MSKLTQTALDPSERELAIAWPCWELSKNAMHDVNMLIFQIVVPCCIMV